MGQARKDGLELALAAGVQNMQPQPESAGRRLQVLRSGFRKSRIGRIDEQSDGGGCGHRLVQQFQYFGPSSAVSVLTPVR